jgi:hypothetical protein
MKLKQALVFSTLALALGFPLAGCGDDDDSGPSDQAAGTSSKAGSKSTSGGTSSNTGATGGQGNASNEGGNAPGHGGEPNVDDSCDPKGADPVMGMLLNAPVDSDVEVVVKKPQHPGTPGPLDLP